MRTRGTTPSNSGASGEAKIARLVRNLLEAWNAQEPERIKTFYAPEYEGVDVGQAQPQRGPKDVSLMVRRYLEAFPDLRFVEDEVVVEGDRAVLVWTAHGTHGGKLMSIPPTSPDGAQGLGARRLCAHDRGR